MISRRLIPIKILFLLACVLVTIGCLTGVFPTRSCKMLSDAEDMRMVLLDRSGRFCMALSNEPEGLNESFIERYGPSNYDAELTEEQRQWVLDKVGRSWNDKYSILYFNKNPFLRVDIPELLHYHLSTITRSVCGANCLWLPAVLEPDSEKDARFAPAIYNDTPVGIAISREAMLSVTFPREIPPLASVMAHQREALAMYIKEISRIDNMVLEDCNRLGSSDGQSIFACIVFVPGMKTIPGTALDATRSEPAYYDKRNLFVVVSYRSEFSEVVFQSNDGARDLGDSMGGIRFEDDPDRDYENAQRRSRLLILPDVNNDGNSEIVIQSTETQCFVIESQEGAGLDHRYRARLIDAVYLGP